jgi:hypothetical protein
MTKSYFIAHNEQELNKVYQQIILWFKDKQYEIESTILDGKYFIQAKKTGTIRTLIGSNLAFKINIYWSTDRTVAREFIVETSIGKWITNIAGAGFTSLFFGGIPLFIGAANAGWALILEGQLITYLETTLKLQRVLKIDSENINSSSDSSTVIDVSYSSTNISQARQKAQEKVAEDLKRIQEAYNLGLITESEFKHKQANLEDKMDEYEADFLIEEKIEKLQKAFAEGIIDTIEYELKLKEVQEKVEIEIINKRQEERKAVKIAKLKEALDNGILTEEEYRNKVGQL